MDLEKNKQRIEILAAEVEELKNNGGGGGDLSDYLTKSEASSTYETQSAATASLALKADKATTYTKTEVDEAIASAAGGGLPAYVNMPTGSNAYFPEDKMEILEKHLPFTTTSSPTDISPVYLFIGCYGGSYVYKEFGENGFITEVSINKNTRKITSTSKDGGGIIYNVNSANYMRYVLSRPSDTLSGENNMYKSILYITNAVDLNNSPYFQPKMVVCQSDATAATLTNCPTVKAFYMLVDNYANRPTQTIFEVENPAIFYRRNRIDTTTWTAWYKFEGTVVS